MFAPVSLENIFNQHPGVFRSAVVGRPRRRTTCPWPASSANRGSGSRPAWRPSWPRSLRPRHSAEWSPASCPIAGFRLIRATTRRSGGRNSPSGRHADSAQKVPMPEPAPTVVVTGGGGFLGHRITALLCARGDDVRVLARQRQPELEPRCQGHPGRRSRCAGGVRRAPGCKRRHPRGRKDWILGSRRRLLVRQCYRNADHSRSGTGLRGSALRVHQHALGASGMRATLRTAARIFPMRPGTRAPILPRRLRPSASSSPPTAPVSPPWRCVPSPGRSGRPPDDAPALCSARPPADCGSSATDGTRWISPTWRTPLGPISMRTMPS